MSERTNALGHCTSTILNLTGNILAGICIISTTTSRKGGWVNLGKQMVGGWIWASECCGYRSMCPWTHRDLVKAEANKSLGKRTRSRNGWGAPLQAGSGHSNSWKQWRGFDGSAVVSVSVRVHFGTLSESRRQHPKCGPQPLKYAYSRGWQILPGAARFPLLKKCS